MNCRPIAVVRTKIERYLFEIDKIQIGLKPILKSFAY